MTLDGGGASADRRVEAALAPRVQIDRMRLLQVPPPQLGVVPPAASQLEDPSLCVASIHTRKQHFVTCMHMHMCEACAQQLPRSAHAALPAGVPVERTTRV